MTSIVIYTKPETLSHKKGEDGLGPFYYWAFNRFPKHVTEEDNIYFATKGNVQGYFEIEEIYRNEGEIEWDCSSWTEIKKDIPSKPFRGFRYKWW